MSLYSWFKGNGPSGFGYGSTAEQVTEGLSLEGKTFLVTGCSSGLGKETLRVLALRKALVVATARTLPKAQEACAAVVGNTMPLCCELADPKSVVACVAAVKAAGLKLDAIVCNAGIMGLPKLEQAFGVELQLFTNHVGHFLLVTGLLEQLTEEGRVVVVSSAAHRAAPKVGIELDNLSGERGYSGWTAYGQSKLANVLFAKELARRFAGTKRTANALHPGVIETNLARSMNPVVALGYAVAAPLALKSVEQGAATQVWAAAHPDPATISGAYLADCNVAKARADADDPALARGLWEATERLVAGLPLR